jgi:2-(1,2-epoxy-1,2-dihydrophenyl)acetyl-CoA isomerase
MNSQPLLQYELQENVALLRFNDPVTLNACSDPMCEALIEALNIAQRESRAIVLTGEGRGFSSGANIAASAADKPAGERDAGARLERLFNPLMLLIRSLAVPFVTAINGPAAGAGCSIALSGDLIVAAESAYFLQAFIRIGLVPDAGSAYLLTKSIGRVRAMEAMMLADKISAQQAFEWGMVSRVVADGDLIDTAMALASRLAAGPTQALGWTRRLSWFALENRFEEHLELERGLQRAAGLNPDFEEGIAGFREKRPARFTGVRAHGSGTGATGCGTGATTRPNRTESP